MNIKPKPPRARSAVVALLLTSLLIASTSAEGHGRGRGRQTDSTSGDYYVTTGCSIFHCSPEAIGAMYEPIVSTPVATTNVRGLGDVNGQGCSGDSRILACLFTNPQNGGSTLQVLDAATLAPLWGSANVNSYNLETTSAAIGQVPTFLAGGKIAAGDTYSYAQYDAATGDVLNRLLLLGKGKNYGLTLIAPDFGIISQNDGTLTYIKLSTWQVLDSLTLKDPNSFIKKISLVSPSSGSDGVLYALAQSQSGAYGYLYAVRPNAFGKLKVSAIFQFTGVSGASPIVLKPAITGLSQNMVLLHVPGLIGAPAPQNQLVALTDAGSSFNFYWPSPIVLSQPLNVAPTVDIATHTVYYREGRLPTLKAADYLTGTPTTEYDIAALSGLSQTDGALSQNGHLVSSLTDGKFTLFLSMAYKANVATDPNNGEYIFAIDPNATQNPLLWRSQIDTVTNSYTAAWSNGPSLNTPGAFCPIVVAPGSGITKICD